MTLENFPERLGLIDIVVFGGFIFYCYDLAKHIRKSSGRKEALNKAQLLEIPTGLDLPRKMNFLDKGITINESTIDVVNKNKIILHLSKTKKEIEIRKTFGKKVWSFNDIQFLFLEYNQYEKDTLLDSLSSGSSFDKNVWRNTVMAMLKKGKRIKLFDATLEETNYEQMVDYQTTGKYEEKSYLDNGKRIIRLFSYYMDKRYLILDNTV